MTAEDWSIRFYVSSDRFIAKGSFGEVYGPCDWKGSTCAIKKLWINKDVSETDTAKQLSSYRKMIELHHKHIITVHVVSLEPPHIFMMMDYAGGGSLKDVLGKLKFHLPRDILKDWGIQIAQGMAYLHGRDMVHRDLKSPNIVIMEPDASSDPNNKTLKITDFDQVREHTGTKTTSFAGTYAWSAPEVITEEKFSKASDVWSYGVVLWEILTRKVPHKDLSNQSIITNASKGSLTLDIPNSCPDIIKCILNECLLNERCRRPSFDNIISMFQNNISVAGEDSKTSDAQHKDRKQSRSLGNRIKTLVMNPKKTALPSEQKITSSETVKTIKEATKKWRFFLEDHMDPNFGLLDKLLANGSISRREIDDVKSKRTLSERNSRLLELIFDKDVCDDLIAALRDANQMHIVNYLTANGEYSDKFGEEWPLQKRESSILDTNQASLVDLLELKDLLGLLFSSKVLNKRQHEWISSRSTSYEKNEALLDILGRGSLHDYRQTIKCLRQSKQSNIAEVLERGGVVVKTHANFSGENVTQNEKELVTKIEYLLSDCSVDDTSRIHDIVKSKIIAGKQGQSIVLYIYCKIIEELQQLYELLTSGELKDSVELWFKSLLVGSQIITVASIRASAEEFQKLRKYFKDMASEEQTFKTTRKEAMISHATSEVEEAEHQPSKTTLNELPLELLDVVLEKAFLHLILNYSHILRDEDVARALASVDFCWFQRTTRLRLKRRIWQRLKDFYGKTEKSSAIIRNNRNYLLNNIRSNSKLIASLLSYDCITEAQGHCIRRKRSNSNINTTKDQSHFFQRQWFNIYENSELLHALRSLDQTKLLNFLTCFRQTNQKSAARIMENGGGVMKVEVLNCGAKCTTSMKSMLAFRQNIEDLLIKTNARSHKTDELISQLKDEGIEILNSELDRNTVVVWIWCRSQVALANCQRVYESNQLRDVLFRVANTFLTDQSKVINIDRNQFKKTIVVRPISINFTQRIYVRRNEIVHGVTKLRNEIYLLCQSASSSGSNVINVFDDGNPFRLQRKINIKQIDFPTDMGSSEKDNCLYVCDFYVRAIWKITKESDGEHNVIMWLTIGYKPSILSVSSEGQLFVLSYTKLNRSTMKVYESDATLIESIQLPEDIGDLHHTAKTSNGNFIVSSYMKEEDEEEEEGEEEDGEWVEKKEGHSGSSRTKRRKMKISSVVSELTRDGQKVIRRFNALNKEQRLRGHSFISLDSDDRVFVIDPGNQRVILLDSDLKWNQVLCPVTEQETKIVRPLKLFYDGEKKQLIVGGCSEGEGVNVYNLSRE